MKTKVLRIRIGTDLLDRIEKVAACSGKNVSEFIRDLIGPGLENRAGSSPEIDPETIVLAVKNALGNRPETSGSNPKLERFLVENLIVFNRFFQLILNQKMSEIDSANEMRNARAASKFDVEKTVKEIVGEG